MIAQTAQGLVFGIAALLLITILSFFAGYFWKNIEADEPDGPRQANVFDRLLHRKV